MTFLFTVINKPFCKILYYSRDLCIMMVVTYLAFNSVKSGCKKTPKIGYSPCSSVQGSPGCSFTSMPPSAWCPVQLDATFTPMLPSARCPIQLGAPFTLVLPSARCSLQFGVLFRSVPPSAASPGQLPSSPTTTAGHLAATCNNVTPVVTYSARNVFVSFLILSK